MIADYRNVAVKDAFSRDQFAVSKESKKGVLWIASSTVPVVDCPFDVDQSISNLFVCLDY